MRHKVAFNMTSLCDLIRSFNKQKHGDYLFYVVWRCSRIWEWYEIRNVNAFCLLKLWNWNESIWKRGINVACIRYQWKHEKFPHFSRLFVVLFFMEFKYFYPRMLNCLQYYVKSEMFLVFYIADILFAPR